MTFDENDCGADLDGVLEDGDCGIRFSQIVLRRCDKDESDDRLTVRRWAGISAQIVVLTGDRTRQLPEMHQQAIKSRKRARQMVDLAVNNTNSLLQLIGHGSYNQVIAPLPLAGSEVFAMHRLLTRGTSGSPALMLCTERAVFAAPVPYMTDLLLMARRNRLSGVLRGTWDSEHFGELSEGDWLQYCEDDFDLFALGAEFLRGAGELPF